MNDDFKNYIQLLIDNKDKIKHLPERDIHNLLDYITNLQQENEMLKDAQNNFEKQFIKEMDYKTRCDKAIKYINNHFLYHYGSEKEPIVFEDDYIDKIADILEGKE